MRLFEFSNFFFIFFFFFYFFLVFFFYEFKFFNNYLKLKYSFLSLFYIKNDTNLINYKSTLVPLFFVDFVFSIYDNSGDLKFLFPITGIIIIILFFYDTFCYEKSNNNYFLFLFLSQNFNILSFFDFFFLLELYVFIFYFIFFDFFDNNYDSILKKNIFNFFYLYLWNSFLSSLIFCCSIYVSIINYGTILFFELNMFYLVEFFFFFFIFISFFYKLGLPFFYIYKINFYLCLSNWNIILFSTLICCIDFCFIYFLFSQNFLFFIFIKFKYTYLFIFNIFIFYIYLLNLNNFQLYVLYSSIIFIISFCIIFFI